MKVDRLRPEPTGKDPTMTHAFSTEDSAAQQRLPEPAEWLSEYGDALYSYALNRLRRSHEAEEAVQETLLAALQARGEFQGRSHPLTWLIAILKRKVVDRLRAQAREVPGPGADDLDAWFDARGKWRKAPRRWEDPAAALERSEFWVVVRRCLARLPGQMAEAFTLRTLDDEAAAEVCRELSISPGNLWVLLHRARLQLVRCLQVHWFDTKSSPC
jgi:RNA polymerase sigma-70 factor (ECF subfamily)